MRKHAPKAALVLALAVLPGVSLAEEKFEQKGPGEWTYEFKDGEVEVKRERKRGGAWKEEVKDGDCEVKRELTESGEYKEEIKCK